MYNEARQQMTGYTESDTLEGGKIFVFPSSQKLNLMDIYGSFSSKSKECLQVGTFYQRIRAWQG